MQSDKCPEFDQERLDAMLFWACVPMLESEGDDRNRTVGGAISECRWTLVPESVNHDVGSMECSRCLQDMASAGKAALLLNLACARCTDMGNESQDERRQSPASAS